MRPLFQVVLGIGGRRLCEGHLWWGHTVTPLFEGADIRAALSESSAVAGPVLDKSVTSEK